MERVVRRSVYGVEFLCCTAVMCRMGEAQLVVVMAPCLVERKAEET